MAARRNLPQAQGGPSIAPKAGAVSLVRRLARPTFTACLPHTTYCPDCACLLWAHL